MDYYVVIDKGVEVGRFLRKRQALNFVNVYLLKFMAVCEIKKIIV